MVLEESFEDILDHQKTTQIFLGQIKPEVSVEVIMTKRRLSLSIVAYTYGLWKPADTLWHDRKDLVHSYFYLRWSIPSLSELAHIFERQGQGIQSIWPDLLRCKKRELFVQPTCMGTFTKRTLGETTL